MIRILCCRCRVLQLGMDSTSSAGLWIEKSWYNLAWRCLQNESVCVVGESTSQSISSGENAQVIPLSSHQSEVASRPELSLWRGALLLSPPQPSLAPNTAHCACLRVTILFDCLGWLIMWTSNWQNQLGYTKLRLRCLIASDVPLPH